MNTAVSGVFKTDLVVPHVHERTDDAFGFAISLGAIDTSKLLWSNRAGYLVKVVGRLINEVKDERIRKAKGLFRAI